MHTFLMNECFFVFFLFWCFSDECTSFFSFWDVFFYFFCFFSIFFVFFLVLRRFFVFFWTFFWPRVENLWKKSRCSKCMNFYGNGSLGGTPFFPFLSIFMNLWWFLWSFMIFLWFFFLFMIFFSFVNFFFFEWMNFFFFCDFFSFEWMNEFFFFDDVWVCGSCDEIVWEYDDWMYLLYIYIDIYIGVWFLCDPPKDVKFVGLYVKEYELYVNVVYFCDILCSFMILLCNFMICCDVCDVLWIFCDMFVNLYVDTRPNLSVYTRPNYRVWIRVPN